MRRWSESVFTAFTRSPPGLRFSGSHFSKASLMASVRESFITGSGGGAGREYRLVVFLRLVRRFEDLRLRELFFFFFDFVDVLFFFEEEDLFFFFFEVWEVRALELLRASMVKASPEPKRSRPAMIMYMNRLNENLISLGIMVYDTERYENCRRALASVRIRKISTKLTLNQRSAKRLNLKTVKTGMQSVGCQR